MTPKQVVKLRNSPQGATGSDVHHTAYSSTNAPGNTTPKGKQLKHVDGSVNRKKSRKIHSPTVLFVMSLIDLVLSMTMYTFRLGGRA